MLSYLVLRKNSKKVKLHSNWHVGEKPNRFGKSLREVGQTDMTHHNHDMTPAMNMHSIAGPIIKLKDTTFFYTLTL